jgi:cardiolipin synthase
MINWNFGWPEFFIYLLAGLTVIKILDTRHNPAASISWIWAVLALPWVSVPLYWFVGGRRVKGFAPEWSRVPKGQDFYDSLTPQKSKKEKFEQIFSSFGEIYKPEEGKAELLVNGKQTYEEIFLAISQAKVYIIVQYYILRSDRIGRELKEHLIRKSKEGVKVFLLIDKVGSFGLNEEFFFALKHSGVRFAHFLPLMNLGRIFFVNNRNHRKLVVIDGRQAFAGGVNIGVEYTRRGPNPWRDTHLKIEGPIVQNLVDIFREDWLFATGESLSFEPDKTQSGKDWPYKIQVIPTGPYDRNNIGGMVFSAMIQSVEKRIWVSTPYFIPDDYLQRDLELAVLRGVDVRVLIPKFASNRFVHMLTLSYAEQMQRRGVKVFTYEPGFLHQKIVLLDDDIASVSTSNFDNRAMYLNFETNILILDHDFASKVEKMLEHDLESSSKFKPEVRKIRKLIKLRDNGARILAPLL